MNAPDKPFAFRVQGLFGFKGPPVHVSAVCASADRIALYAHYSNLANSLPQRLMSPA